MLQELLKPSKNKSSLTEVSPHNDLSIDIGWAFLLASLVATLTLLWFSFDHHFPSQDEAEHIMNSMRFRDLLAHCHLWRPHWWHDCLTVNGFYPPFIYFINGSFLLLFGQSRFTEQLSMAFFTGLMTASLYGIARILNGSRGAAVLSAFCLSLYPVIFTLSHGFLLDLPAIAMAAFALMTLLWWRSTANPSWKRTLLLALVLGCACLSKQLVAVYLLPVGLYFILSDINFSGRKPKLNWLIHLLMIGIITTLIGLPFLILNHNCLTSMNQSFLDAAAFKHGHSSYLDSLNLYFQLLPLQMSPFLFGIFLLSPFFLSKEKYIMLTPIIISAIGGYAITCTSAWTELVCDQRYTAPSLVAAAIYTGFFLEQLIRSGIWWQQVIAIIAIISGTLNYFFFNFVPYPIPLPTLPWQASLPNHGGNPVLAADWGQDLVLETIEKVDGHKTEYLNVLINSPTLNVHTFELLLKEKGNTTIIPTSSRSWTILGDKVLFSPETALYFQWYLLKSNSFGFCFYDKKSEQNYNQLINFICNSGKYNLIVQKTLPDKSSLVLYHRIY